MQVLLTSMLNRLLCNKDQSQVALLENLLACTTKPSLVNSSATATTVDMAIPKADK